MEVRVEHDREAPRFFAIVDGHLCVVDYRLEDGRMVILHTGVPEAVEGKGIAGAMMRVALDTARAEGWRVEPRCAYAEDFLRRHPGYADLVD
jgi:predicted GNAT family acetyltransferase